MWVASSLFALVVGTDGLFVRPCFASGVERSCHDQRGSGKNEPWDTAVDGMGELSPVFMTKAMSRVERRRDGLTDSLGWYTGDESKALERQRDAQDLSRGDDV